MKRVDMLKEQMENIYKNTPPEKIPWTGIDFSETAIEIAKNFSKNKGIK